MNIQVTMGLLRFVAGKGLPSFQRTQGLHIVGHAVQEGVPTRTGTGMLCRLVRLVWQGNGSNATKITNLQQQSCGERKISRYKYLRPASWSSGQAL